MIVALRLGDTEANRNDLEEGRVGQLDAAAAKVLAGVETQLIQSGLEIRAIEQSVIDATITVGDRRFQEPRLPTGGEQLDLKTGGWLSRRGIENVSSQAAHQALQITWLSVRFLIIVFET
jgi:hypothetical protein